MTDYGILNRAQNGIAGNSDEISRLRAPMPFLGQMAYALVLAAQVSPAGGLTAPMQQAIASTYGVTTGGTSLIATNNLDAPIRVDRNNVVRFNPKYVPDA